MREIKVCNHWRLRAQFRGKPEKDVEAVQIALPVQSPGPPLNWGSVAHGHVKPLNAHRGRTQ